MTTEDGRPEEFRASWAQTWHNFIKPFLPVNIIVFLFLWFIGYAVGGVPGSILLPVAVVGGIVGLQRVASRGSIVRISGYGIEIAGRDGSLTGMRWADVRQVVLLNKKRSGVVAPYGVGRAAGQASAALFADANSGPGLIGVGTRFGPHAAGPALTAGPIWLERQADQVDVRMFLMVVDRAWPDGPIGAWVRRYRPDLLAPAPTGTPGR